MSESIYFTHSDTEGFFNFTFFLFNFELGTSSAHLLMGSFASISISNSGVALVLDYSHLQRNQFTDSPIHRFID